MTSSQRIAINTIVTYGRSIIAMGLGLFSSRWVLLSLGEQDFGLYSVVGSLIVFITFLNGVSAGSVARFFAFSIGQGSAEDTNRWFNTALILHTVIPFFLFLGGWFSGDWLINEFLNIPAGRLLTCQWVFRLSLLSAFVSMMATPYIGMHTAKQKIAELALWNLLSTAGMFTLAFMLTKYEGNALLAYSLGLVTINITVQMIQIIRAKLLYSECRICFDKFWDYRRIREVLSFSTWQLFGSLGAVLRGQGTAILLNKYFPPSLFSYVNASYGIGNQIAAQSQTFSGALIGAFTPEIVSAEGRGDRKGMLRNALRASKYATFLILLFAIPLLLELDLILEIWLREPPQMTSFFCRLFIVVMIIDNLTVGQMVAVSAKGKIAGYQVMLGGFLIFTLPIAWIFLHFGGEATTVMWAFLITMIACSSGRVIWAWKLVDFPVVDWFKQVLLACLVLIFGSMSVGYGIGLLFEGASLSRLFAVGFATLAVNVLMAFILIIDRHEKNFILHVLKRLYFLLWGIF